LQTAKIFRKLIGGFLYKNIANRLYGSSSIPDAFDWVVENANNEIILPEGWHQEADTFGNPKLTNGKSKISFILNFGLIPCNLLRCQI